MDAYSLKKEEVGTTEIAISCILVAHPKGILMGDNGIQHDFLGNAKLKKAPAFCE